MKKKKKINKSWKHLKQELEGTQQVPTKAREVPSMVKTLCVTCVFLVAGSSVCLFEMVENSDV